MTSENINISVLYFAKLGDDLACTEEKIQLKLNSTLNDLLEELTLRGDPWHLLRAPEIRCAVNQNIVKHNIAPNFAPNITLHNGDEVAFFPPVTGG